MLVGAMVTSLDPNGSARPKHDRERTARYSTCANLAAWGKVPGAQGSEVIAELIENSGEA